MLASLMFVTIAAAPARAAVLPQTPVAPVPTASTQTPAPAPAPAAPAPIVPIVSTIPVVAPMAAPAPNVEMTVPITPMVAQGQQPPPVARPGQTPPRPQPTPTTAPPMRPPTTPQPGQNTRPGRIVPTQNVRVEVTITDTFGSGGKKVVSMLIADNSSGQIRASNDINTPSGFRPISINVDASPSVLDNGRVYLNLSIQYVPDTSTMTAASSPKPATINESIALLVNDGKSTLISQSADPATDRRVTVEVTATVVK
jgi:hypothetical protein